MSKWVWIEYSIRIITKVRKNSKHMYRYFLHRHNKIIIQGLSQPAPDSKDLCFERQFGQSFAVQTMACFWKQHWSYW